MQYVYILNYSVPCRVTVCVDDKVEVNNDSIQTIFRHLRFKEDECSWMVSKHKLPDEKKSGVFMEL